MEANAAQYEFDTGQNQLVGGLARKMMWVAWFTLAVGALALIFGIVSIGQIDTFISALVQGGILFLIGLWTRRAALAFQLIVDTEGADVSNLMAALGELRKLYTLQFWLLLVSVGLAAFAILAATILGFAG